MGGARKKVQTVNWKINGFIRKLMVYRGKIDRAIFIRENKWI